MKLHHHLGAGLLALAAFSGAQATSVSLATGAWQLFDVVDPVFGLGNTDLSWIDINDGSNLSFTFTIGAGQTAYLTVVDGAFAGDEFTVTANGLALAAMSIATNSYPDSIGLDFDSALADGRFSQASYKFTAGSYTITGALSRSALDDSGLALNTTVGGIRLDVPEPTSLALLMAAGGALVLTSRRRTR